MNSLTFSLTRPNCIIQLFYKKESELRRTVDSIQNLFEKENIKINITLADTEEEKINTLPFL